MNISFKHSVSTYTGYILLGFGFGLWAMLIPFVKERLNIDKVELGALLLMIALGAVISMFFTGFTAAKFGCKKTSIFSSILIVCAMPVLIHSHSIAVMALFMFIYGMGLGMLDVTLNIQGAILEEHFKKALMAGYHSMYSFGVFFTILIVTYLLKHTDYTNAALITLGVIVVILLITAPMLLNYGGTAPTKLFIKPTRILFILGIICFISFVAEGVMLDWSALFMQEVRHIEPKYAGYSFSLFYLTMGIFRFLGDAIMKKYSYRNILFFSSIIAIIGLFMMIYIPYNIASFIGFTLAGAGIANLVPVTISATGKYKGNMPLSIAVSSVATIGYFGTLFGPSIMGFVSEYTSLTIAFTLIGLLLLLITILSRGLR